MALLDRLSVLGVRSFGPENKQQIKFNTPLTLLLGHNGCGKTTIIECLKYALTGDLPAGTDGGRGFLNDPKLSNTSSTRGFVKVRFKDAKGDFITVGKFMTVTSNGSKLTFMNKNPTLRWEDDQGNSEDIAGRCVDLNTYCCQKLNVSKAIINNVIFCHQENSAWPLEEAKKLKEKFDEIFGASEYKRCVESLRKDIKNKKTHLKLLMEQLATKLLAKKSTERLQEFLQEKETKLEEINGIISKRTEEIDPLQSKLNEINELVESLSRSQQTLAALETTLKGILEQQQNLKKHIDVEYEGTDEELHNEISNFGSFQESAKKIITDGDKKKLKIDLKIKEIHNEIQKDQVRMGQLTQEQKQYTRQCDELKEIIEKAKHELDIETSDDEPVADIIFKLNDATMEKKVAFEHLQQQIEQKEKHLQKTIDKIRDEFATAKENYASKKSLISENENLLTEKKSKITKLSCAGDQRELIERKLKDAEAALQEKRSNYNEQKEQDALEQLDEEIASNEKLLAKLEREFSTLERNYLTEQKIDSESKVMNEKKGELAELIQKNQQHFDFLFKGDLPMELERSIVRIQKSEEVKVNNLHRNITEFERKVASLDMALVNSSERLKQYKLELAADKKKLESVCKGVALSDLQQQSHARREKLQKDKGFYQTATSLYERFIEDFKQDVPCCPVCSTDFTSSKSKIPEILSVLKAKIEDFPKKQREAEALLRKEEDTYNMLQQLKPVSQNIFELEKKKIPQATIDYESKNSTLENEQLELVSLKSDLVDPQKLVEVCRKVLPSAAFIDRLRIEIRKSEKTIDSLKQDLVTVASNRTADQAKSEIYKLKADLASFRLQYRTKRDLFDRTKEIIQTLESRVQTELNKKVDLEVSIQELPVLQRQVKECQKKIQKLEKEKSDVAEIVKRLENDLHDLQKRRDSEIEQNKKNLDNQRQTLDSYNRLVEEILKLHKVIDTYERSDFKSKLSDLAANLLAHDINIQKMEEAKNFLNDAMMKKKEELASQESKFRSLTDNRDLRSSRQKSQDLRQQVEELKRRIGHQNNNSVLEERRTTIAKIDSIQNEVSRKNGEKVTVMELIKTTKADLIKNEHKNAASDYKKKYYETRVSELAIDDLETYTIALEKSILKFHKERMVQLNMIIRELWRNIYKGNDIDFIEIQTVDDIGAGRRRSYDYKVVQVKKGVELEMRGRCSAGQKVLACLVIRMALAETFSASCGILALDEPTTNLDKDNITSLCDALSKIITYRQRQKNFQLLVITHDEEFIETLTRDQNCSNFYRISRNNDGFSEITKENL